MPTTAATCRFASATYALPGPTITSTATDRISVPYASAAIACAPPMRYSSSTLGEGCGGEHRRRAIVPSGRGGVHKATAGTPATRAGMRRHQDRRRQRRPPAGHVAAGPIDRDDELPHVDAGARRGRVSVAALGLVPGDDLVAGELERGAERRVEAVERGVADSLAATARSSTVQPSKRSV